jgi:hypothetical protein
VHVSRFGADGDLKVQLTTTADGQPTNEVLAETTLPPGTVTSQFPNTGELITANFGSPAEVVAGQEYAIVLRTQNGEFVWNWSSRDGMHAQQHSSEQKTWYWTSSTLGFAVYLNGPTTPADTTLPVLSLPSNITKEAEGPNGSQVTFQASATDENPANPTVSCASASGLTSGDAFPLGTTTVSCEATDEAGNKATGTFDVTVSYAFGGFFRPVDNPEVATNSVKAGSAVPVKFTLGGDMGLGVFESGYPKSQQIPNPSVEVDGIEQTVSAGSSGLSYDPSTDQYTYVWKTEKAWSGQFRQLVLKFDDGTTVERANFKFTR